MGLTHEKSPGTASDPALIHCHPRACGAAWNILPIQPQLCSPAKRQLGSNCPHLAVLKELGQCQWCVTKDAGAEAAPHRHTPSHMSWWSHNLIHLHLYPQNSKPTRKPQRAHRLPCPKPVRCSQNPWVRRALLQGCFYGYKLFMLDACKIVMLNKSLLQPAEGKVVFKVVFSPFRTSSAHELSLLTKSKQTPDRIKRHQRTTFVQI